MDDSKFQITTVSCYEGFFGSDVVETIISINCWEFLVGSVFNCYRRSGPSNYTCRWLDNRDNSYSLVMSDHDDDSCSGPHARLIHSCIGITQVLSYCIRNIHPHTTEGVPYTGPGFVLQQVESCAF